MSKPKKLKVGDIWGVPKTLDVRVIEKIEEYCDWTGHDKDVRLFFTEGKINVEPFKFYGHYPIVTDKYQFLDWIEKKGAVKIGHYDFKTGKAISKGGSE